MNEHQVAEPLLPMLTAELDRAFHCEQVWVMNLDWYKQVRREAVAHKPEDDDEAKWVPSIDDRMFGLPILVRGDGGKPHIEWMTREELSQ